MGIKEKIKEAESDVNTSPTDAQKNVGNYKKGKVTIKGFKITIENPVGSIRKGINRHGVEWESEVKNTYGYFNGTVGKDGDHVDLYLGPVIDDKIFDVFIVDQLDEDTRAFDEHKVMFGFEDEESSIIAYLDNFEDDWKGFGNITKMALDKFKKWVKDKDAIKLPASKISKIDYKNIDIKENSIFKIIKLEEVVEEGITLNKLKEQAGDISKFDTLIVKIASPGGSVSEGLETMVWLNSLSREGKFIITLVTANAYSIASLIMLAANLRLISKHGKVMVHNPMLPELKYANADLLELHLNELRDLEKTMYNIYNMFTGLSINEIKVLMDKETYLTPNEAVQNGFADEVIDMEQRPYIEAVNIKKEINMSKTINVLNKVIAMVNKSPFVNQLYNTSEGETIEIFQNDPATFAEGDRTSVKEGEVKLADGSKLKIEDSIIKEIDREIEEEVIEDVVEESVITEGEEAKSDEMAEEVIEEVKKEEATEVTEAISDKKAEQFNEGDAPEATKEPVAKEDEAKVEPIATEITEISKWEVSVVQDKFEVGMKIEYKPFKEGEDPKKVVAGEYVLEDGRKLLIDSDGIIQLIKEANVAVEVIEEEKEVIEDAVSVEAPEEVLKALKTLKEALDTLTEKVEKIESSNEAKFKSLDDFEETATEAIDVLATNTVSNFKPEAKASVGTPATGSIFSQMKKKRGIK